MGFFKRFFSLSSGRRKKDKRKQSTAHGGQLATDAEGRIVHPENRPNDSDATRLLRSASARWASTDAIQTLAPRMCDSWIVVYSLNSRNHQPPCPTFPYQHPPHSLYKHLQAVSNAVTLSPCKSMAAPSIHVPSSPTQTLPSTVARDHTHHDTDMDMMTPPAMTPPDHPRYPP